MDEHAKNIIRNEIAPVVQLGRAGLFLGAGFSIGTITRSGTTIPSTMQFIERILLATGHKDENPSEVPLSLAFSVGKDEIKDFDKFIIDNFLCKNPFEWQLIPFRYWWRRIYTTNIDNVGNECVSVLKARKIEYPKFQFYNYRDRMPPIPNILEPPVATLHGSINRFNEGFVFDGVSYADHSVRGGDFLHDAALSLAYGNCILVGSRLQESDLEGELRKRKLWEGEEYFSLPSWIVLDNFKPIEIKGYEKRGFVPVQATAQEFFEYLSSVIVVLSPGKFIKRIAPHLSMEFTENNSIAWFNSSFVHIPTIIANKKSSKGIYSRFLTGDMPDWYYIAHGVPAEFDFVDEVNKHIISYLANVSAPTVYGIAITGKVASGKTTLCRILLNKLSGAVDSVYEYNSENGLDIEYLWATIKNMKGTLVLYFDNSCEHFYAINEIASRVLAYMKNVKVVILFEERDLIYQRERHHLSVLQEDKIFNFIIPDLSKMNALKLLGCLKKVGLTGGEIEGKTDGQAVDLICDREKGFRGDLLATLCDITSEKPFERQLREEYEEIRGPIAKRMFELLSMVSAARLTMPMTYIAEIYDIEISSIMAIIKEELWGKVYIHGEGSLISARHHVIADYHLRNMISNDDKEGCIISLMRCVSKKFNVTDIKRHPLPYRIYKATISHHFLGSIFTKERYRIENIYSVCQAYFADDAFFWLQYGKFLQTKKQLRDAEHCYRKGLSMYESFQIQHALGHILLEIYIAEEMKDIELLREGKSLLIDQAIKRGSSDPYPYNSLGLLLVKILKINRDRILYEEVKKFINEGLKYHRDNPLFQETVKEFISLGSI